MKKTLAETMSDARSLVSRSRLGEATVLIRDTLGGGKAKSMSAEPLPPVDFTTLEIENRHRVTGPVDAAGGPETPAVSVPSPSAGWSTFPKLPGVFEATVLERWIQPGASPGGRSGLRPGTTAPTDPRFRPGRFQSEHGILSYKLYVPASEATGPRPLIVMLHGCKQDPDDFSVGTRMNELAEAVGAIVLYPEQTTAANQGKCWNWFERSHQHRGSGEPAMIAGAVAEIAADFGMDRTRIFAAGLSAGGAMAAVLGVTYPDVFAAVGIHSGLPYGAAGDVMSALKVMRKGIANPKPAEAGARPSRMIVFHGNRDTTVHPSNGDAIAGTMRRDGAKPSVKQGFAGGRGYTRTLLPETAGLPGVEYWQVDGLGHAWSGGNAAGSYTDPTGPDASREMLRFFLGPAL